MKSRDKFVVFFIFVMLSVFIVNATTIITDSKVDTNQILVGDNGDDYKMYHAHGEISEVPEDFRNAFIIQTTNITNDYHMEVCFWDNQLQKMSLCLNEGAPNRATTFYRSLQIAGNEKVPNNRNFTLCQNYNYIDCNTTSTGADLGVQDDIEAKGSIYSNEHITVKDFLRLESTLDKGDCNVSTHGNIVYELAEDLLGTHYACRQKKDAAGYEWKPLY